MLTVTEKAAQYLLDSLSRKREGAPLALRIVYTEEGGFRLTLDDPKEGDQIFEQDGRSYLVVDPQVSEALTDAIIDVQESPQGLNLTLTATPIPPSPSP